MSRTFLFHRKSQWQTESLDRKKSWAGVGEPHLFLKLAFLAGKWFSDAHLSAHTWQREFQLLVILKLIVIVFRVQTPRLNLKAHEFDIWLILYLWTLLIFFLNNPKGRIREVGNLGNSGISLRHKCLWILTRNSFKDENNYFVTFISNIWPNYMGNWWES